MVITIRHDRGDRQGFWPAATETLSFSLLLIYCNVIDHLARRVTLKYIEHQQLT